MGITKDITKNLGGDRLGSGNKNDITLKKYNRSTHDLSYAFRSSMTPGVLYPFMKIPALNGDTFDIDLSDIVKTIPTLGPLYGSYKLQLDIFESPMRLYNGLLHNNMVKIGLNMDKVKVPKITISTVVSNPKTFTFDRNSEQISNSALLKYLGLSGLGDVDWSNIVKPDYTIERTFNAIPILAYWDIYKNYYANTQEGKGVVITPQIDTVQTRITKFNAGNRSWKMDNITNNPTPDSGTLNGDVIQYILSGGNDPNNILGTVQLYENEQCVMYVDGKFTLHNATLLFEDANGNTTAIDLLSVFPNAYVGSDKNVILGRPLNNYVFSNFPSYLVAINFTDTENVYSSKPELTTFDLENIDTARIKILQDTGLGNEFSVNTIGLEPYKTLCDKTDTGETYNKYTLNGLGIKTYQSDIFQNWLQTEWIDGVGGINEITAIDTSSGSFQLDAFILSKKVYNMLNRIAVTKGTYEDWQEAVFSVTAVRRAETPVYKGGLSSEIVFQEVVSTAESDKNPLGSLAGRGGEINTKGGHVQIYVEEPSYIIGIASITPRVDYSQGNDWDITEIDTMDDWHKPAMDGIGFEDLLQERMSYIGTYWDGTKWVKLAAGKTPAFMNYMTAVNKTYGDFADTNKCMFMTLNRQYEYPDTSAGTYEVGIADMTTYVDPTKYNYAFADTDLEAQNFWVQIGCKVIARRVMSAKTIPFL